MLEKGVRLSALALFTVDNGAEPDLAARHWLWPSAVAATDGLLEATTYSSAGSSRSGNAEVRPEL